MKLRKIFFFSVLILTLVLGACSPVDSEDSSMGQTTEAMMDATEEMMAGSATPEAMAMGTSTPEAMTDEPAEGIMEPTDAVMSATGTPDASMDVPAWLAAEMTNVTTGESFALNDFHGKVVLVELMAQWCPTCLRQQQQVVALHEQLGMDGDLVTVALDIDPNEDAETLKTYAAEHGFDWIYAVAPADVAREIGNLYGAQYLNPPSAPMLLIDRNGMAHPLPFGVKSAGELYDAVKPLLDEDM